MYRIAHLIDDQSLGGVTRYLDFIARDPGMSALAQHEIVPVARTRAGAAKVEADLIVSHLTISWRGLPGLMALRARYPGTPLVHVEHSYSERFVATNVRRRNRFHSLLRCAYALFDKVVAVSGAQGDWLRQRELVDAGRFHVIRPCVELDDLASIPAPTTPIRRIGAIGRLDDQKGFDVLISAFRSLQGADISLEIFGDGPERDSLVAMAGDDARITFHGAKPAAEAYAGCDLVAMPSRWEPYGLVAVEARAAGRPVLVSGADGLSDHLRHGAFRVSELSEAAWNRALVEHLGSSNLPCRADPKADMAETIVAWEMLITDLMATTSEDADTPTESARA